MNSSFKSPNISHTHTLTNIKDHIKIWLLTQNISTPMKSSTSAFDLNEEIEVWPHAISTESNTVIYDHITLKSVLAHYTGQAIQQINTQKTVLGKPYLVDFPKLYFSVSHTKNFSCIAVSNIGEIGIDIENEQSTLKDQDLPFTALSANEQAYCLTQANQRQAFFSIWTAKEALLKAIGCGLNAPLSDFSVLPNGQSYHFIPHTAAFESLQTRFKHYLTEDGIHVTYCILT